MTLGYTAGFEFEKKINAGEKIHTIRPDIKNRWRAGNSIQHVTGNRTKLRKQFASGYCESVQHIVIVFDERGKINKVTIDEKELREWQLLANNDGLSIIDFENWFFEASENGVFKGKIIHWTNYRY